MTTSPRRSRQAPGAPSLAPEKRARLTIDTHQHFWSLRREPMPWMTPEHATIARDFDPCGSAAPARRIGIDRTILVQSACTDGDTDAMFAQAAEHPWIAAVTAWVDLRSRATAEARLDVLAEPAGVAWDPPPDPRGARPHWILRPSVLESLAVVEERGLVLELPCVYPATPRRPARARAALSAPDDRDRPPR